MVDNKTVLENWEIESSIRKHHQKEVGRETQIVKDNQVASYECCITQLTYFISHRFVLKNAI